MGSRDGERVRVRTMVGIRARIMERVRVMVGVRVEVTT